LVALVPDEADYHDIRLKLRVNRAIWLTRLGKYEESLLRPPPVTAALSVTL